MFVGRLLKASVWQSPTVSQETHEDTAISLSFLPETCVRKYHKKSETIILPDTSFGLLTLFTHLD